jgi:hypothetical protein
MLDAGASSCSSVPDHIVQAWPLLADMVDAIGGKCSDGDNDRAGRRPDSCNKANDCVTFPFAIFGIVRPRNTRAKTP